MQNTCTNQTLSEEKLGEEADCVILPAGNPATWMYQRLGLSPNDSAILGEILFSTQNGRTPFNKTEKLLSVELGLSYTKIRLSINGLIAKGILEKSKVSGKKVLRVCTANLKKAIGEVKPEEAMAQQPSVATFTKEGTRQKPLHTMRELPPDEKQQVCFDIGQIRNFTDATKKQDAERTKNDLQPCDSLSIQDFVSSLLRGRASQDVIKDCIDLANEKRLPAFHMNAVILTAYFHCRRSVPYTEYLLKMIKRTLRYELPRNAWETVKILESDIFCPSLSPKKKDEGQRLYEKLFPKVDFNEGVDPEQVKQLRERIAGWYAPSKKNDDDLF